MNLSPSSDIPLYAQLREDLWRRIREREFAPGDQLPTEEELKQIYGVSTATIRRALSDLVNEGIIYRKAGRGTFVAQPAVTQDLKTLVGFAEAIAAMGDNPSFRLVQARFVPASRALAGRLGTFGTGQVLEIERVFLADHTPIALGVAYYPKEIGQRLIREDLNQVWVLQIIEEDMGILVDRAYEEIGASVATPRQAKHLEIEPGEPILTLERVTYRVGDIPIEWGVGFCRADLYRYRIWRQRRPPQ